LVQEKYILAKHWQSADGIAFLIEDLRLSNAKRYVSFGVRIESLLTIVQFVSAEVQNITTFSRTSRFLLDHVPSITGPSIMVPKVDVILAGT
jgi:hypothetical protein